MKKAFAIVIAAFFTLMTLYAEPTASLSSESASIPVKYTVKSIVPTFKLVASGYDVYLDKSEADGNVYRLTKDLTDMRNDHSTVDFTITQISDARLDCLYEFTVTATDLVLTSTASELGLSAADYAAITETEKKFVVETTVPAVTKHDDYSNQDGIQASLSQSANTLTVNYRTNKLTASLETPVELGKFSCTWKRNTKAVNGVYYATIKMEINTV